MATCPCWEQSDPADRLGQAAPSSLPCPPFPPTVLASHGGGEALGCQGSLGHWPGGLWLFPEIFTLCQPSPGIRAAHCARQSCGSAALIGLRESNSPWASGWEWAGGEHLPTPSPEPVLETCVLSAREHSGPRESAKGSRTHGKWALPAPAIKEIHFGYPLNSQCSKCYYPRLSNVLEHIS